MPPHWKKQAEEMPSRSKKPEPSITDSIAQFFYDGAWYDRDAYGLWHTSGFMVSLERRRELERAWRAAGNVPPPVPEL